MIAAASIIAVPPAIGLIANDDAPTAPLINAINRSDPIGLPIDAPTLIPPVASVDFVAIDSGGAVSDGNVIVSIPAVELWSSRLDLGSGYRLSVNEQKQFLLFENTERDARTMIWGNGRIEGNTVSEPLQFWGTTSLSFGDEGLITLQTRESGPDTGVYLLDKVSVSTGDRGVVITGLTNDIADDLKIDHSKSSSDVDYEARDGFTLFEKPQLEVSQLTVPPMEELQANAPVNEAPPAIGWLDDYDNAITQSLLNATAVGGLFGPGSDIMSRMEFSGLMARFFAAWSIASLSFQYGFKTNTDNHRLTDSRPNDSKVSEKRLIERILVEQALIQKSQLARLTGIRT